MNELRLHDPIEVIKYGLKNKLENQPGWEWIKPYLPGKGDMAKLVKAMKVATGEVAQYKFGVKVPRNVREALVFDKENKDTKWQEAMTQELNQLSDFDTFRVVPEKEYLAGYRRIPYMMIFDVKFDGRRKA